MTEGQLKQWKYVKREENECSEAIGIMKTNVLIIVCNGNSKHKFDTIEFFSPTKKVIMDYRLTNKDSKT